MIYEKRKKNEPVSVSEITYIDYKYKAALFKEFLRKRGKLYLGIQYVTRDDVLDYLDDVLKSSSPGNRNTHRKVLSGMWTVMVEKRLVPTNFIRNDISKTRSPKQIKKLISMSELSRISEHLTQHDPVMLLYIKVLSYNFLRPVEACRIQVKHIDIDSQEVYFIQKTKRGKTKYIPDIYFDDLKEYIKGADPDDFLFTPERKPGPWSVFEKDKRGYWTKAFAKVRKKLGMESHVTLYNFRHTFITALYVSLKKNKGLGESEALQYLQRITGHDSIDGLRNYIHSLDADKPEDWSELIEVRL
jgi:integrase